MLRSIPEAPIVPGLEGDSPALVGFQLSGQVIVVPSSQFISMLFNTYVT